MMELLVIWGAMDARGIRVNQIKTSMIVADAQVLNGHQYLVLTERPFLV